MKLYYTNPDGANAVQSDPDKSLGGWLSITQLPNDLMGNLFGTISEWGIDNDLRETKALMLINDTGNLATSITLHYENASTDEYSDIEMAVVSITTDGSGNATMENIVSTRALPVIGTFVSNKDIGNAISLPDMADGEVLGIWIKRTLNQTNIAAAKACDTLFTNYEAETPIETKEDISIVINYT